MYSEKRICYYLFDNDSHYCIGKLKEDIQSYEESAVWNNINAVKNKNVYIVDRSLFAQDAPIATMYGIDIVVDLLKDK